MTLLSLRGLGVEFPPQDQVFTLGPQLVALFQEAMEPLGDEGLAGGSRLLGKEGLEVYILLPVPLC